MSNLIPSDTSVSELLPSPSLLKEQFPATSKHLEFIIKSRSQVERILTGSDPRLLLIVGPCSIHDLKAAEEYALKLKALADEVSSSFLLIMRAYFEKPRTSLGWKGMLYDPHLNGSHDIATGLQHTRQLLLLLADMEIGAATEFLDPTTPRYIGDLISWACIGARTAESQIHRQFASGLHMPVAFKNNTSGNIDVAINGVLSAISPHAFFGIDESGHIAIMRTKGNPHAHIALRGGDNKPNFDDSSIRTAMALLKKTNLPQRIIIDCSHDNSCHKHEDQSIAFRSVIDQYLEGNKAIRGLALESHLFGGKQQLSPNHSELKYAVSLTDACLDWSTTETLVRWGSKRIEGI